jgi:hypothetical protein
MKRLTNFIFILIISLSSTLSYSSNEPKLSTTFFTLPIPKEMHEIFKNEDKSHNIYQYVYQTDGDFKSSGMQLRLTQIKNMPKKRRRN